MKIEHVNRHDGNFQWIRALDDDGVSRCGSVGVALPGTYDFPPSKKGETIRVLSGWMIINGVRRTAAGHPAIIKAGEAVHIEVETPSRYMADHVLE